MEDAMKVSLTLLSLVLAGAAFPAMPTSAKQAAADKPAPAMKKETKETKWQGRVVRINKDSSEIDIKGGINSNSDDSLKVAYDSSTHWTKVGKPGQQDDVKEGSFVIVLGKVDDKGVLHASRIDLRMPR
jgi:RNA polymerase subunit RPABC4/transcription elongation factor Spt4